MDDTVNRALQAVQDRAWYALAAYLLVILIALGRRLGPSLWERIPAWARPWVPVLTAAAGGFVAAFQEGAVWTSALAVACYAAATAGAGAVGLANTAKRSVAKSAEDTLKASAVLLVALGLPLVSGCAGSFEEARTARIAELGAAPGGTVERDVARCQLLDDERRIWGAIAQGAAVFSGASGIATLPVDDEDRAARIGLASGALVAAATAAVAVAVEQSAAESWARECSAP